MNNTFTNVLLVVVLVLLIGFGVWYFTSREAVPPPSEGPGIELNIQGQGPAEGQ